MKTPICALFLFLICYSCTSEDKKVEDVEEKITVVQNNNIFEDSTLSPLEKRLLAIPTTITPVLGYRFVISGDFNGDGKKEQLIEHYFSSRTNEESNKYFEGLNNYEEQVDLTVYSQPYSFVLSDNSSIDTLVISRGLQLLGLSFLKNEGDLDGDGIDDISYVVQWADWSSLNTWHVVSYKNKKWTELYSFPIWDWQLPDLPETNNRFGLFGLEQLSINTTNDSVNQIIEHQLNSFEGLLKKVAKHKIHIIYRRQDADMDSVVIDLRNPKELE